MSWIFSPHIKNENLMVKALLKIILGSMLVAGGIALEGLWLAFCFGTVIVGIFLLLWFTPILLFPFAALSVPGWAMLNTGLQELNPPNIKKISSAIAPIVTEQIEKIERLGGNSPLDARVLAYIAALSFVAGRRNLSLQNVIDITAAIFTEKRYRLYVQNLEYCVDYSDNLRGFWDSARRMTPLAQAEMSAGKGDALVKLFQQDKEVVEAGAIG